MSIAYAMKKLSKNSKLKGFLERKRKRLEVLESASKESSKALRKSAEDFLKKPNLSNYTKLSKVLFNSSTWLGKSTFRLFRPIEPSYLEKVEYLKSQQAQYILKAIAQKKTISHHRGTYSEIFKTIFYDFEISHLDRSYQRVLNVPKINTSVLLISGVLNEIFTTPAFERGAKYIKENYDIDFDYCPTSGTKTTQENSKMIKEHFDMLKSKDRPVWFFAFSKGGIDVLHFLKEYSGECQQSVAGLSTVASPILGSERVNHKVIKLINSIHSLEENKVYQYFDRQFDFLFKDFQKSLSSEFQESWFQENFSYLPRNMFYTALALEANWYESHVWMILTKLFFQSPSINDGIVDAERALYPEYFQGINLGILKGHHLIGTRSSDYVQEALIEAHIVFLNYLGLLN